MNNQKSKIFTILLAGGNGVRVGNKIPKQFIFVNHHPMFFYPLKTFTEIKQINEIIFVTNKDYRFKTSEIINQYEWSNRVHVIDGGETRHQSIILALLYLKNNLKIDKNDVILTHDVARPLVSKKIIYANIEALLNRQCEVVSTAIKTIDTVALGESQEIKLIFNREKIFLEQTPQSARYKIFEEVYFSNKINNDSINEATDFCKLAFELNKNIKIVDGDKFNFKITDNFEIDILDFLFKKYSEFIK